MALKLGNLNINKIYLGSTPINKIYLGSTLIFGVELPKPKLTLDLNMMGILYSRSEVELPFSMVNGNLTISDNSANKDGTSFEISYIDQNNQQTTTIIDKYSTSVTVTVLNSPNNQTYIFTYMAPFHISYESQ